MENAVTVAGLRLGGLDARACTVHPHRMFNGRLTAPTSLTRECG